MSKSTKKLNDFSIIAPEVGNFKVVYEQKSINGAARKLGRDAGNISRMITKLEEQAGTKLFNRHKNGLQPTESGNLLYASLLQAQEAFSVGILTRNTSRRIRLGFSSMIAYSHLSKDIIQTLLKLDLQPEFIIENSLTLTELLKKREIDFALVHSPVKFPGIINRAVATEGIFLCSKSETPQKNLVLHPDMLASERLVHSVAFERSWLIKDYFVIAKLLQENSNLMGLIPESLIDLHSSLKVLQKFPKEGKITALSWPGSIGLELLKML